MKKKKKAKTVKSKKTKGGPNITLVEIEAWETKKTIDAAKVRASRNGFIYWDITNKEKSKTLTIGIGNFVPVKPPAPSAPVKVSAPVTLAHGKTGKIIGKVHGVGNGDVTYKYNVIINDQVIDPEVVVCDDPGPVPPGNRQLGSTRQEPSQRHARGGRRRKTSRRKAKK